MKKIFIGLMIFATASFNCKKNNTNSSVEDCNANKTTSIKFTNASSSPMSITLKRQDQAADVFVISNLAPGESITKTFSAQLGVLYWGVNAAKNVAYLNVCGTAVEILN